MANGNFIRDTDEGVTALEVIGGQLGNFVTPDEEEEKAGQWEKSTGRLLQRSWESTADFEARKKKLEKDGTVAAPDKPKHTVQTTMDPNRAEAELRRLSRSYDRPIPPDASEKDIERWKKMRRKMNDLRTICGLERIDYNDYPGGGKQKAADELAEKWAAWTAYSAEERLEFTAEAKDRNLMRKVAGEDPDEKVRKAAEKRLKELSIKVKG